MLLLLATVFLNCMYTVSTINLSSNKSKCYFKDGHFKDRILISNYIMFSYDYFEIAI